MSFSAYLQHQSHPVVFPLPAQWPCSSFTLEDWEKAIPDVLTFRTPFPGVPKPHYEYQTDRFTTKLKVFRQAVEKGRFRTPDVNLSESWVYSSYNWMSKLKVARKDCLHWKFVDPNETDCSNTTIWFGTEGAFTPCHRDSYGFNLVVQLIGRKEWTLFPPEDSERLYQSRLPYEETSVFSTINFIDQVDVQRFPRFADAQPYRVVLEPGQVLLVPKHWWHFVRCLETSVSVNRWFEVPSDADDRIDEALAALLVSHIDDLVEKGPAYNGETDCEDNPRVILEAIRKSLQQRATSPPALQQYEASSSNARDDQAFVEQFQIRAVPTIPVESFIAPPLHDPKRARIEINMDDLMEAVMHPDVLSRIRRVIIERTEEQLNR